MNKQPEALRLADVLMDPVVLDKYAMKAAAKLPRQHDRIIKLEAALRQAVEVLAFNQARWQGKDEAITTTKQALGEQR